MSFGSAILVFCILALLGKIALAVFLSIFVFIVGWKAPKPVVDFFENKRKKMYAVQMVDALNLLANGLRAGLTMPQAIGMVVDEIITLQDIFIYKQEGMNKEGKIVGKFMATGFIPKFIETLEKKGYKVPRGLFVNK